MNRLGSKDGGETLIEMSQATDGELGCLSKRREKGGSPGRASTGVGQNEGIPGFPFNLPRGFLGSPCPGAEGRHQARDQHNGAAGRGGVRRSPARSAFLTWRPGISLPVRIELY
uniref:Uncharacterized protein n=1 Tax=Sphaerodactylus townsendi TaxID=933632 RepID=A0ACB8G381_9SAUR